MLTDPQAYGLAAAYLLPLTAMVYLVYVYLAKLAKRRKRWPWYIHVAGIVVASAIAPFVGWVFVRGVPWIDQKPFYALLVAFISVSVAVTILKSVVERGGEEA